VDRKNGNNSVGGQVYIREKIQILESRLMNLALTPDKILDRSIQHVICVLLEKR
jgi:hypothetical protein